MGPGKAYRFPIQDLYIPLTTAGSGMGRKIAREETLTRKRVVIVGDPGSGKTTFLRRLAFEACGGRLALCAGALGLRFRGPSGVDP